MSDDETYEIPLQDQRIFGAGIKRKRVKFVPSSESSSAAQPPTTITSSAESVSSRYLSLVLPGDKKEVSDTRSTLAFDALGSIQQADPRDESRETSIVPPLCEICNNPLLSESTKIIESTDSAATNNEYNSNPRPHEASLAHQVCLEHSHPPSHLDRNRKGLAYLSSYGWDPDSRTGLGVSGQGIQFPIKVKPKDDKMGIGLILPPEAERRKKEKPEKLDAGKVRKLHDKDKKKAERLREMFYRADDVERYLGGG